MDPSTAVRTDTLPAIATLVAPGALASCGYVWLGVRSAPPGFASFLATQAELSAVAARSFIVAVGVAIDSAGSYVEFYAIDRRREDPKKALDYWWKYLTIAWTKEPIGQNYILRVLVSFKFELNMCVASVAALLSVPMLYYYDLLVVGRARFVFCCLAVSAVIFFWFAKASSDVLQELRYRLVKGV